MRYDLNRIIFYGMLLAMIAASAYGIYAESRRPDVPSFKDQYNLTLRSYEGEDVELSDYRRKLLVVHTWASWCPYCRDEIRNLVSLKQTYGEDVEIIAINRAEPLGEAKSFTDSLQVGDSIRFLLDPDDAFYKQIGGYAMPETIFINSRGDIIYHQRGPMELPAVTEQIDILLGKDG